MMLAGRGSRADVPIGRRGHARERSTAHGGRSTTRQGAGTLEVAFLVGALLAVPGPFDLIALGRLARGQHAAIAVGAIIVAFALIKFVLIQAPIVSYTIDPDGTAAKVQRFSNWMQANKVTVVAVIAGLIGVGLIARGLSGIGR